MADYIRKCPECGGINLFWNKEKGEIICKECGLVVEEKMVDFGQEWREFDDDRMLDQAQEMEAQAAEIETKGMSKKRRKIMRTESFQMKTQQQNQ